MLINRYEISPNQNENNHVFSLLRKIDLPSHFWELLNAPLSFAYTTFFYFFPNSFQNYLCSKILLINEKKDMSIKLVLQKYFALSPYFMEYLL